MPDYLTESNLGIILEHMKDTNTLLIPQLRVPNTRMHWDFLVTINNIKYIVEFDGDSHYRDPGVILRDELKDKISISSGYKTVRIPYFVQISNEMWKYYFGLDASFKCVYPHGFIDKKAALPASFCPLGLKRYYKQVQNLLLNIQNDIYKSLEDKVRQMDRRLVFP